MAISILMRNTLVMNESNLNKMLIDEECFFYEKLKFTNEYLLYDNISADLISFMHL